MTPGSPVAPALPAKVLSVAPMLDRWKHLGCMRVCSWLCARRVLTLAAGHDL